jgi:hypothetical protein
MFLTVAARDVIALVDESMAFTVNDRVARSVDFKADMPLQIQVNVRHNLHVARSVVHVPKQ